LRARAVQVVIQFDDRGVKPPWIGAEKLKQTHVETIGVSASRGVGPRILLEHAGSPGHSPPAGLRPGPSGQVFAVCAGVTVLQTLSIAAICGWADAASSRSERVDFSAEPDHRRESIRSPQDRPTFAGTFTVPLGFRTGAHGIKHHAILKIRAGHVLLHLLVSARRCPSYVPKKKSRSFLMGPPSDPPKCIANHFSGNVRQAVAQLCLLVEPIVRRRDCRPILLVERPVKRVRPAPW